MKVIGIVERDKYICEVSHFEIEKFLNLYYCNNNMEKAKVGDIIDLGKGHDFARQTQDALRKTSDFINANKEIIRAITDGIVICGRAGGQE